MPSFRQLRAVRASAHSGIPCSHYNDIGCRACRPRRGGTEGDMGRTPGLRPCRGKSTTHTMATAPADPGGPTRSVRSTKPVRSEELTALSKDRSSPSSRASPRHRRLPIGMIQRFRFGVHDSPGHVRHPVDDRFEHLRAMRQARGDRRATLLRSPAIVVHSTLRPERQ